ncbi:MAG TPA: hypothetical protein VGK04_06160 [Thermoanaerobaculia bacterium]
MKDGGDGGGAHQAHSHVGEERQAGRLAYEGVHSGLPGALVRFRRFEGTEDDDHRRRGMLPDKSRQIQPVGGAVRTSQLDVDDGYTVLIGCQVLERLFGARRAVHGVTLLCEILPEAENDAFFVVYYENSFHAIPAIRKERAGIARRFFNYLGLTAR